ncbi:hypothetical protein EPI10_019975 [Gossypium australe]|uniref:Uncharacterized protein n=1 Tax=Gossypium australe TaxID=47621 RepID=A0A5B6WCN1_9ROSI|nr:hypothetical protein EPI10_019975 [Gossypium australe]
MTKAMNNRFNCRTCPEIKGYFQIRDVAPMPPNPYHKDLVTRKNPSPTTREALMGNLDMHEEEFQHRCHT